MRADYAKMQNCVSTAFTALQSCAPARCDYVNPVGQQLFGDMANQDAAKFREMMASFYVVEPTPNGQCVFTEKMAGATITCNLNPQQRKDLAAFQLQSMKADSTNFQWDGKGTTVTLDGQQVRDVHNEFIQQGICK